MTADEYTERERVAAKVGGQGLLLSVLWLMLHHRLTVTFAPAIRLLGGDPDAALRGVEARHRDACLAWDEHVRTFAA